MGVTRQPNEQSPQTAPIGLQWAKVQVYGRSRGWCEKCSTQRGTEYHHRQPRGMGGSRDPHQHSPANLVNLCADCHRWVEAHPTSAYRDGWKIKHGIEAPTDVPLKRFNITTWLDHTGHYTTE